MCRAYDTGACENRRYEGLSAYTFKTKDGSSWGALLHRLLGTGPNRRLSFDKRVAIVFNWD